MATVLKAAGKKDLLDKVMTKLRSRAPEAGGESGTFEVARSSERILSEVKYVLTTGLEPLDAYTGGLPFGRVVEVFGLEGSGKSALAIRCCARAQGRFIYERKRDENGQIVFKRVEECDVFVLYVDNEQSIDDDQKLVVDGIEIDAMIGRCDTVDQMFKMIETVVNTVAEIQEKQPDRPCFVVSVVDTIAGTSSKEELKADWGAVDYVRQPAQLRRGFRRITREINRHNVLWLCTNQVGDNFKAAPRKYGSNLPRPEDFTTFGGRALKFYASLRIFMFIVNSNYKLNKKSVGGPSGFVAGFITVKNRQAKPLREGRVVMLFDRGLSNVYSILETMIKTKLAERDDRGNCAFKFNSAGIAIETFEGLKSNENPRLPSLAEWPAFYEAHKVDIDKLWNRSLSMAFNDDSLKVEDEDAGLVEDDDAG